MLISQHHFDLTRPEPVIPLLVPVKREADALADDVLDAEDIVAIVELIDSVPVQ